MTPLHVLALVGSLREAPVSRLLAEAAERTAPPGIEVAIFEGLDQLPGVPAEGDGSAEDSEAVARLRESILVADAVLVFAPAIDDLLPGPLRAAIDWASRPYGEGALEGKKTALLAPAGGVSAQARALVDLRRIITVAGGVLVENACATIGRGTDRPEHEHPADDADTVAQLAEQLRLLGTAVRPGAVRT
ncbi:NAD(P)H-dependent oxidoreductase [Nocardia sp. NPDC005978]|uniref:NAD(P)H-dependent oxidoreductase n=1 Tax=Nocardia sp. NPDC005978 TaxID=3156725 RepID=UPI0033BCC9CB